MAGEAFVSNPMRVQLRHIILVSAMLVLHGWCHAQFTGGSGDGHVRGLLVSTINCASYYGSHADGYASAVLANPVPCTAYFASQRDGHAVGALPCAPLTVVTSELFGQVTDGDGYLWWYSFTETQNLGFAVERSHDLAQWTEIAFLPGQESSGDTRKYDRWDREMLEGVNYYRWRQLDLGGAHTLSNTVALIKTMDAGKNLILYPNPAGSGSLLHMHCVTQDTFPLDITIVDALGQVVQSFQLSGAVSPIHHAIATEALSAGMYFLILDQGSARTSKRFVVR
jgi:Secretion system C-terminal sorting domain